MTSEDVILEKIEHLSETVRQQWKGLQKQGDDIGEIKKTVGLIAVQSNRIDNLSGQVQELWMVRKEHDERLNQVQQFQASCPREAVKETNAALKDEMQTTMKRQWAIIALMATLLVGALLKGVI